MTEAKRKTSSSRCAAVKTALAAPAVFGFVTTALVANLEYRAYRRLLELDAGNAVAIVIFCLVLAKSWAPLTLGIALAALAVRRGWMRAGVVAAWATSTLLPLFLTLDLVSLRATGNSVLYFAQHLLEPDPLAWAGDLGVVAYLTDKAGSLVGPFLIGALAAGLLAYALRHGWLRADGQSLRGLIWAGLGICGLVLLTAGLGPRAAAHPSLLHLHDALPWSVSLGTPHALQELRELQYEAAERYREQCPPTSGPVLDISTTIEAPPNERPDIALLIIESFRHDALTPEVMPHLWKLSRSGMRMTAHYSVSNASHYGIYGLLYGELPLSYFESVGQGAAPALVIGLRKLGYRTHFTSGAAIRWQAMEGYINEEFFDSVEEREDSDRSTLERIAKQIAEPGPALAVGFLMGTHFPFHHPKGSTPFRPALTVPAALDPALRDRREELLNRYRNAANYLDRGIGSWLASIDIDNTLVIVTGDHGESIFDDGTLSHASRLSDIQLRVPFVAAGPGIPPGRVIEVPTSHIDLWPSLRAQLDLPALPSAGQSVFSNRPEGLAEQRAFVPTVHARGRAGRQIRAALSSPGHSYELRLEPATRSVWVRGRLDENGLAGRLAPGERELLLEALPRFFAAACPATR